MAPMRRRVLVIDDHPGFRASARALLEQGGFEVVGEADDGRTGLAAAAELRPDLVLLDVVLPDIDGFEVARRLMDGEPGAKVVLVSTRDELDYGGRVARVGASGFIQKSSLSIRALETVVG
jgi:DNA-binding NarL/FixJ family response regulator